MYYNGDINGPYLVGERDYGNPAFRHNDVNKLRDEEGVNPHFKMPAL